MGGFGKGPQYVHDDEELLMAANLVNDFLDMH